MFSELAKLLGLKSPKKQKITVQTEQKKDIIKEAETEHIAEVIEAKEPIVSSAPPTSDPVKKLNIQVNKKSKKNKIPVLSEDFDFYAAFDQEDSPERNEKIIVKTSDLITAPKKAVQLDNIQLNKLEQIGKIRKDKKGILQLSSVKNIEKLLESGIESKDEQEHLKKYTPDTFSAKPKRPLKDKNKIPIISESVDLSKAFGSDTDNEFHSLLNKSLKGKSKDALLRDKKEKISLPRPIPVEQRIKRYPAPQEDLDLHGFTGIEADRKTDIFIRSARSRGLFTVKIIVGKGTHSQGRAVLPDVVEDRLAVLKNEREVLTFRWEKRLKTHSGAVIVYLNQFD